MRDQARQMREEATAEAAATFREPDPRTAGQEGLAAADALNWGLDIETLVRTVTEHLRRSDDIPLRLLLESAPRQVASALRRDDDLSAEDRVAARDLAEASVGGVLDRLASLAGLGTTLEREDLVVPVLNAFFSAYNLGFTEQGMDRGDLAVPAPRLWRMVIERLYAVGAYATRRRQWGTIRAIAASRPATHDRDYYGSLIRHGHIMAARAGEFQDPEHSRTGMSLLMLALQHIARLPDLRPDADTDDERLLSSLCEFDLLLNIATVHITDRFSGAVIYPHFKRFYSLRSDPAVVWLLEDESAREALFPRDDQALSDLLASLGQLAAGEFFYINGWDGYSDPRILRLFDTHPPQIIGEGR